MRLFSKVLIFGLLGYFGFYVFYNYNIDTPVDETATEQISFIVRPGAPVDTISQDLKDQSLIRNEFIFKLYLTKNKLDKGLQSGRFLLTQRMDMKEIITTLSSSSQGETVLIIQEGLTIRQIDQKLQDLGVINPNDFIEAVKKFDSWGQYAFLDQTSAQNLKHKLEGFIYPDTYFISSTNFQPQDLIQISLNNFQKKLSTIDLQASPVYQKYSLHEIITMASIVENEVFGAKNREIVAGIFWKRLENNWTLGADITSIYEKDGDRNITATDLQSDSPYNTRKNLGLPPGPISNPSIESIQAVLFPKESDYWFYLTTLDTGEVIYAKTNDEHNLNRSKYL
ncbi:endolytic transglycosylase MltG [Candidatus Peregrinibacteria bacterium HGW-Peregrinibacteria-1]|jgi:UPF0755 protein|nr:MAG: endolytic transglycosylase MltG [Candidatus Peregrinibacteria bacterium HGW-Peregrinibacteria-1]